MNYDKELAVARKAAKRAGAVLLRHFKNHKNLTKSMKDGSDFATEADFEAEKVIISVIQKSFPDHNILSEEKGDHKKQSEYTWIIDPLDGTHNFSFGVPIWGTMVALLHKKELVVSVVYLPVMREMCWAQKGKGTFINGKRVHVSAVGDVKKCMIYYSGIFKYSDPKVKRFFDNTITELHRELRILGSISMGGVFVASGRMGGLIVSHSTPWDVLPIALLIEEAGGKVSGFGGESYKDNPDQYVLSNGLIHKDLLNILKR